jgi:PAS domain-containing protein
VRESSRQLQIAVDACKIPMVILDEKGRIRLLSEGWTTYSGYTRAGPCLPWAPACSCTTSCSANDRVRPTVP